MSYSCAYFETPHQSLDDAQFAKLDIICRKLRLQPGERVLDIGCGWGGFALHAAKHYGVNVVAITLSATQAEVAKRRVLEAGLSSQVTVHLADYRDELNGTYDAIATIGMVEHVGRTQMDTFAATLFRYLRPGGRALVHGITIPEGMKWSRASFLESFVFPDGELESITWRDSRIGLAGLELRDTEDLREHYAMTLRHWNERLTAHWAEAIALVGEKRARVWKLYMTGAMVGFTQGTVGIYQSLFVRLEITGNAQIPLRRSDWYMNTPAQHSEEIGAHAHRHTAKATSK